MNRLVLAMVLAAGLALPGLGQEDYLKMDAKTAKAAALSMRVNGQVGGSFDFSSDLH